MKKIIALVLVVAMVLAFSASAFALDLTCNSTSSYRIKQRITRSSAGSYNLVNGTGSINTSGSATALTIRPYNLNTSTKCANATTYRSGALYGGKPFWDNATSQIDIWGSLDQSGTVTVSGTFTF